jgi:hypothetical protein
VWESWYRGHNSLPLKARNWLALDTNTNSLNEIPAAPARNTLVGLSYVDGYSNVVNRSKKEFVLRVSSLNHRSWISEPVLIICSSSGGTVEKSIFTAPQSARRPSASVNPYSRPSSQELKSCPDRSSIAGSAASAATARPTNSGDSDSRKFLSFFPPSAGVKRSTSSSTTRIGCF